MTDPKPGDIDALKSAVEKSGAASRPPRAERPPLFLSRGYLTGLGVVLVGFLVWAMILAYRYRQSTSKYLRQERDVHATMWRVEHLRGSLLRAERMARQPDLDHKAIEDIDGQCEEIVNMAAETLKLAPLREDVHWLRGQAQEMRHRFDDALDDYADAIRLFEAETARYTDREHVPYSIAYLHRAFLRTRLALRKALLDEDDAALRKDAFEDFRRANNNQPESAMAMRTGCLVAMDMMQQRHEDAIRNAGVASTLDPTDWRAVTLRGVARHLMKDDANALSDLSLARRMYPYAADAHAWRGRVLQRLGRRDEAAQSFAAATAIDARFVEAYVLHARVLVEDGRFAEAEPQFGRAMAVQAAARPLKVEHARTAYEAWKRGGRLDRGFLDRGLASLSHPEEAGDYILRARFHVALGSLDAALTDAHQALSITKSVDGHAVRAQALAAKGDWAAAAADFGAAGERRERARCLGKAKKYAEAIADYDALLKEEPGDVALAAERVRLIADSGDADAALKAVDTLLERSPGATFVRVIRAEILFAKDDVAGAIAEASTAYDADPTQAEPLVLRGRAFAKQGNKANAKRDWEKALELAPGRAAEIEKLLKGLD